MTAIAPACSTSSSRRTQHAFANTTVTKPVGAHFLGMLATTLDDLDIAEAHFEAALAAHEQAGAPLLAAETQLEWARAMMRRPDQSRAATLLERGTDRGPSAQLIVPCLGL